ncbi:MAG: Hint domain-containing protein [Pseudomonadota bacterium]
MPVFYAYTDVLLGTQTTINGAPVDYAFAPNGTWRYTGSDTYFVVEENDGATVFNGDGDANEFVDANERLGGAWQQTVDIGGTDRQVIWDYTFEVTDGTNTWRVGVIDVDLNNDNDLADGAAGTSSDEDGYFLVFPDGMPPADTDLSTGAIVENDDNTPHLGLGATVVCFEASMPIDTPCGPRAAQHIKQGDLVLTPSGPRAVRWSGQTPAVAAGPTAPIVISAGALGNTADLVVSPNHAILLDDWRAELFFGEPEVLVRAKDLLHLDGVYRRPGGIVTYCHILLDSHDVVRCNGIWSETLYPGSVAIEVVGPAAAAELSRVVSPEAYGSTAAQCLKAFEATLLAA